MEEIHISSPLVWKEEDAERVLLPKPDSGNIWISVRYEKLQNFCYSCGKIGHDNRDCDDEKLRSSPNSSEPRFGAWLATTVCRSWDDALWVNKEEELEAGLIKETDRTSSPVVSTPTQVHVENPLALVPFCGKEMNAMIDSLGNLGLKRSAAEDWESVNPKKRGVNMGNLNPIADISTFARDLRKVKVRIRRGTRKKEGGGKENIPMEEGQLDDVMEEPETYDTTSSTFTFKAGSGKRKKMVAGGWPLSTTKAS
ncbi:hypothetical protein K1719_009509 [Acacia pycnantha]|nr:hypothetical protein K1719_009509 [Acacia pycnantha]